MLDAMTGTRTKAVKELRLDAEGLVNWFAVSSSTAVKHLAHVRRPPSKSGLRTSCV